MNINIMARTSTFASWASSRSAAVRSLIGLAVAALAGSSLVIVVAQSQGEVVNGRFDKDTSGWKADKPLIWSQSDADNKSSSGSLELRSAGIATADQCVALPDDSLRRALQFSVQVPANQPRTGQAYVRFNFYEGPDCSGSAIAPVPGPGLSNVVTLGGPGSRVGTPVAGDTWTPVRLVQDRPARSLSVKVQLTVESIGGGGDSFAVRLDNVALATVAAPPTATPPPPASTGQSSSAPAETAPSALTGPDADSGSDFPWLYVVVPVLVAVGILGAGGVVFTRRRRA